MGAKACKLPAHEYGFVPLLTTHLAWEMTGCCVGLKENGP